MEQPQNRYTFQIAKRRFVAGEEGLRSKAISVVVLLFVNTSRTFTRPCTKASMTSSSRARVACLVLVASFAPSTMTRQNGGYGRETKIYAGSPRWRWRVLIMPGHWASTWHDAQPSFHVTLLSCSYQHRPHPALPTHLWMIDPIDTQTLILLHTCTSPQASPQHVTSTKVSNETGGGTTRGGQGRVWASTLLLLISFPF